MAYLLVLMMLLLYYYYSHCYNYYYYCQLKSKLADLDIYSFISLHQVELYLYIEDIYYRIKDHLAITSKIIINHKIGRSRK